MWTSEGCISHENPIFQAGRIPHLVLTNGPGKSHHAVQRLELYANLWLWHKAGAFHIKWRLAATERAGPSKNNASPTAMQFHTVFMYGRAGNALNKGVSRNWGMKNYFLAP